MAITQDDLDKLDKKIAGARRRIRVDGREIENQTLSEMLKARAVLVADLAKENAKNRRRTSYRARTKKGW